jgi:membrane associated rhomboid family serine protease/DNA-directed RNA polymerase subunit M/transcription elongation factor TFIIS
MAMRCPKCNSSILLAAGYQNNEVDVCQQCGGIWFEKNELNSVLSSVNETDDEIDFKSTLGDAIGTSAINCPACASALDKYHLLKDYHVEVDLCHRCEGTWIDHEELEQVRMSPQIREQLHELNQGINWKTWLLQFLSQMPVEYNVKPRIRPVVNLLLILLNCIVFAVMYSDPGSAKLLVALFGSNPQLIEQGQHLWGPLTAIFLHGGLLHLAGNMYFLYVVGDNLEDVLGHWRYLALYLLCGVGASFISLFMNWGGNITSIGASGAIAGLFGMYLVWFRYASFTFMIIVYQKKISVVWYFGIWILINIIGMLSGDVEVDYWAHFGGFVIGLLIGWLMKQQVHRENPLVAMLSAPEAKILR